MDTNIRIDVSRISPCERRNLGRTFLAAVERFYDDPKNVAAFEEWKKTKGRKKEVTHADQRRTADGCRNHNSRDGGLGGVGGIHCTESDDAAGGNTHLLTADG